MKRFLIIAALFTVMAIPALRAAAPNEPTNGNAGNSLYLFEITDDNFNIMAESHKLLIVDFWASWCGPCRAIAPIIEELSEEYAGRIVFGKCDIDKNKELVKIFNITSIPTIHMFINGKIVSTQIGACSKETLKAKIEEAYQR